MAKKKGTKKNKGKQNNQEFYDFPDYMEVTPELRKIINSIPNPFIFPYILGLLAAIAGVIFVIMGRDFSTGLIQFYYYIFGVAAIIFAIGEYFFTVKKNISFNKFKKRDKHRIIWTYTNQKYEEFYNGLKHNDKGVSKNSLLISVGVMALLTVFLYFTMNDQMRITAIPFGIICVGVILVTGFVIPRSYIIDAGRKPYISILDDDSAYAIGRYYKWEKGHVKLNVLNKDYGIDATEMRITYQEPSLFGKKTPTFQILIPNNEQYTLMFARREAKRINKNRKFLNENAPAQDDFMDKAFRKLVGQEEES